MHRLPLKWPQLDQQGGLWVLSFFLADITSTNYYSMILGLHQTMHIHYYVPSITIMQYYEIVFIKEKKSGPTISPHPWSGRHWSNVMCNKVSCIRKDCCSPNIPTPHQSAKGQSLLEKAGAQTDFSYVPGHSANFKDTVVQENGSNPQNYF